MSKRKRSRYREWDARFNLGNLPPILQPFFQPGQGPVPGVPPFAPPGQVGQQAPTSPPPGFVPQVSMATPMGGPGYGAGVGGPGLYAVDPGALRPCLYRYVYVWLTNGRSFWVWPTFIGPRSLAGYRWTRYGWRYFGIDLNRIDRFYCY